MWIYENKIFESSMINDYYGFVYKIENLESNKFYIGKKFFWASKILPPNKTTRKRKKRIKVESDWKNYYGSSGALKEDINKIGKESFSRTILHLCKSRGECSYLEMKEQMINDVLLKPEVYYNSLVGGKIHRNHVKRLFLVE